MKWHSSPLPSTRVCSSSPGYCFGNGPEYYLLCTTVSPVLLAPLQCTAGDGPRRNTRSAFVDSVCNDSLNANIWWFWDFYYHVETLRSLMTQWTTRWQQRSTDCPFPALSSPSRGCLFFEGSIPFQSWKIQAHSPSRFLPPPWTSRTGLSLYAFVPPVRRNG